MTSDDKQMILTKDKIIKIIINNKLELLYTLAKDELLKTKLRKN